MGAGHGGKGSGLPLCGMGQGGDHDGAPCEQPELSSQGGGRGTATAALGGREPRLASAEGLSLRSDLREGGCGQVLAGSLWGLLLLGIISLSTGLSFTPHRARSARFADIYRVPGLGPGRRE